MTMDPQTKVWMDTLRERRDQLSEVDTIYAPDIAARVQADLRRDIYNLEGLLHAKVKDLDGIISVGEHRMTFSYRMDREDILRALGVDIEEPERDTPKLNALMNKPRWIFDESPAVKFNIPEHREVFDNDQGDPVEVAETAHIDMGPTLETLLILGHDEMLARWVEKQTPVQLAILRVMGPRFFQMVEAAYAKLPHMEYPEYISKPQAVKTLGDRRPRLTSGLADLEEGSFDD